VKLTALEEIKEELPLMVMLLFCRAKLLPLPVILALPLMLMRLLFLNVTGVLGFIDDAPLKYQRLLSEVTLLPEGLKEEVPENAKTELVAVTFCASLLAVPLKVILLPVKVLGEFWKSSLALVT
jgi:hypothetical protein